MTALLQQESRPPAIMEVDQTTILPDVQINDLIAEHGSVGRTLHIPDVYLPLVQHSLARLPSDTQEREIYQSRSVRAPGMVLTRLKNCYWVPELGFLVSRQGKVWRDSTLGQYFDPHFTSLRAVEEIPLPDGTIQTIFYEDQLANVPIIKGLHLLTSHYASTNYGHFMLDMVPIISIGHSHGLAMLTRPLQPWQSKIYELMGVDLAKVKEVHHPIVFLEDVIISNRHNAESTHCAHPEHKPIFAKMLAGLSEKVTSISKSKGLFLMRRESKSRNLSNRKQLAKELSKVGILAVYPEEYTLQEQALLLSDADLVTSEFGALVANVAFCKPGTRIIEVIPEGQNDPWSVNMCTAFGLDYIPLFQPVKKHHRKTINIGGKPIDNIHFKYKADVKAVVNVIKALTR
jgi:capsular polysaccharide biosynthesis protein